jgi:hypothetical protein
LTITGVRSTTAKGYELGGREGGRKGGRERGRREERGR